MKSATASQRRKAVPRVKVWLEMGGDYAFGRGISDILKAVEQTGSIKEAAGVVGKSYRYVWSRIKQAEAALGATLVKTQVGGKDAQRSALTGLARELVAKFDALRGRMLDVVEAEFAVRWHGRRVKQNRGTAQHFRNRGR